MHGVHVIINGTDQLQLRQTEKYHRSKETTRKDLARLNVLSNQKEYLHAYSSHLLNLKNVNGEKGTTG